MTSMSLTGSRPVGYRAPWWQLSLELPDLLRATGSEYDSSLMDDDVPYLLETDDGPLVELPVHWSLDDWEQYCFLPDITGSGLIETPAKAVELWRAEFLALREVGGCWVLTNHPFLRHYLTQTADGCTPAGTSGAWNSLTGASDSWQQVAFDLGAYAGKRVEVSLSYVTDPSSGGRGASKKEAQR